MHTCMHMHIYPVGTYACTHTDTYTYTHTHTCNTHIHTNKHNLTGDADMYRSENSNMVIGTEWPEQLMLAKTGKW